MTKQNLRDREIAIALENLQGKQSIQGIRDHLKKCGLINSDADAIEQWELEQTRKMVQEDRKRKSKGKGEVQLEWINLFELDDTGAKRQYYKKFGELTPQEGAQLLAYWNRCGRYADKQFHRYYRPLVKKHGRKIQRLMTFAIPVKANQKEPA